MNYPENLKKGDTIGICAPSAGIGDDPRKLLRYREAKRQLMNMGYEILETESVLLDQKGRSASAKIRAKEFIELYENPKVKLIIFACGGDFLCEMLDYINWKRIKELPPKWLQGYSDITGIGFLFNTILDIPTIYGQNIKDYAMRPLHKSLLDSLKIESGIEVVQESFKLYEKDWTSEDLYDISDDEVDIYSYNPNKCYDLGNKVEWKNLKNETVIEMRGRMLGGCLDCILSFIGTKYDKVGKYLEKYKDDGIIWFFDCFELGSAAILRALWQMKNAGYFKYCSGIIFGRPLFAREDYDITFRESVNDAIGYLNIPVILDADIGHRSPQMAIINGGYAEIRSIKGKGIVKQYLR